MGGVRQTNSHNLPLRIRIARLWQGFAVAALLQQAPWANLRAVSFLIRRNATNTLWKDQNLEVLFDASSGSIPLEFLCAQVEMWEERTLTETQYQHATPILGTLRQSAHRSSN